MDEITDTHKRAALRGRESVAQARIKSGVWAARIFAVFVGVQTIVPLLKNGGPDWLTTVVILTLGAGLLFAAQRMLHGSQVAAMVVVTLFVLVKLSDWSMAHQTVWTGILWTVIIFCALCNGVWGTRSRW